MSVPVTTHRFTVDEYHRMGEVGIFHEDDRVELIDGQVVEMTAIGPRHVACVVRLTDLLAPLTDRRLSLSVQNPLVLADRSEPQPDLAVLRRRADSSRQSLPTYADALLVIEVADTSIAHDRDVKIPLYARAGIPEVVAGASRGSDRRLSGSRTRRLPRCVDGDPGRCARRDGHSRPRAERG